MLTYEKPSGCSLGFVNGLGKAATKEHLLELEKRALASYWSLITCLMATTSKTHNSPETEQALTDAGFTVLDTYDSNTQHPGKVKIWIKRLANGAPGDEE